MDAGPQTWHYGLVAKWWAEFNDDFRPHEIAYFQRHVERGQPALDVGCGTGRLLFPFLRAGLDVDGCDVSADMIELCRERAGREGFSPALFVQPMHELDPPRRYRTIYVCGAFGLGSTREQDRQALTRFRECLEPGGTLLVDIEVPYADPRQWRSFLPAERSELPGELKPPRELKRASDGSELGISSRLVELDPLEQRGTLEIRIEEWRDGALEEAEERLLTFNLYFKYELQMMLERAGFSSVVVEGDHNDAPPTPDDEFLVYVARASSPE
ncbi:MAG TPA: class I SAM-dependent methyltransferase [Gaiellaceae bacterium]|nr:class I SAM-dependent methyltransferase [Gaiellaceae bacterium]